MELGIAVLIFSLIAGVVTIAVAGATVSGAKDRLENAVSGRLRTLVATTVSGAYDDLVSGAYSRPEPCAQAAHRSCIDVMGRSFTVNWSVSADADDLAASSEDPLGLRVTASTTMPDGTTVSAARYRAPENIGAEGTAVLRIRSTGETHNGLLYLIQADGSIAGAGQLTNNRGAIRTMATNCTREDPCRLALTPAGGNIDTGVGINPGSLENGAGAIVLTENATSETSVRLDPERALTVSLLAENPDGRRRWAPTLNTVCLTIETPAAEDVARSTACNTEVPDRVTWRSITGLHGETTIPNDAPLTILTDPSTGTCPGAGQRGWDGSWVTAAVCTTWTWGAFDEIRPGITGLGSPVTQPIMLGDAGETHYSAVWAPATTTTLSIPAGGWTGDPLWENPRDVPACATSATCTPSVTSPETACPGEHCNHTGGNAPVLTAPHQGSHRVAAVATPVGANTTVTLSFADQDGGSGITVTVLAVPSGLELEGEPVTVGTTLLDIGSATGAVELTHTPAGMETGQLIVRIGDGENERTETIYLAPDPTASVVLLRTGAVHLAQNSTTASRMLVIDASGEGAASFAPTITLPDSVVAGTPVNGGTGWFTVAFTATNATRGATTYDTSHDDETVTAPIVVAAAAAAVTISPLGLNVDQGGTATATLHVTDAVGDDHVGATAWVSLRDDNGAWPIGARAGTRGCITGAAGTCSITIRAEDASLTGDFDIVARSGTAEGTTTLTIDSSIRTVTGTDTVVEQGSSGTATITVSNGRHEPAATTLLTLASSSTGVSVPASVTTDGLGTASITVSTTDAAIPGTATITVTAGGKTLPVNVKITGRVSTVTGPGSATRLAQSGSVSVTVTARNPQGDPQSGRTLDVVTPAGVYAPATIYTLADGSATFNVSAAANAGLGNQDISIRVGGVTLTTLTFTVVTGVTAIAVDGTLASGAARTVTITVSGSSGLGLSGRSIVLRSTDSRIAVNATPVSSNGLGRANFTITSSTIPAGIYRFTAVVDGRELPIQIGRP